MAEVRKRDCVFTKFFLTITMRETTLVKMMKSGTRKWVSIAC